MNRLAALLALLWACILSAAPQDAVVRVTSHGASATVVWSGQGKTLLLGCAHAYRGKDRAKPMTIDAPAPSAGAVRTGGIRLVKVDYERDLSLVEMGVGPLPYVCPIAPEGHRPGRLLSVGYDEMRTPPTMRGATLLESRGWLTFTREKPWHGRSGGALIDTDAGRLVGVVQAYEARPGGRGVYASHSAILDFVGWRKTTPAPTAPNLPKPDC